MGADFALHSCPKVCGNLVAILGDDFVLEPSLEADEVDELETLAGIHSHVLDLVLGDMVEVAVLTGFLRVGAAQVLAGQALGGTLVLVGVPLV